jgi:pseudaminic acid synthase
MIQIAHSDIGSHRRPFIIAEMSGNHNQSLDRALALVDAAADAGVDAVKLQTFTADTMTLASSNPEFTIQNQSSLWKGQSLHKLYHMAYTPWEWHADIMARAKQRGLVCFSSPFDATAVDFLETLNVPAYKIASFECIDLPLIRRVAQTGKPMIISTGMASIAEIAQAVDAAKQNGCQELVLLKCTSTYPASPENTHLRTIPHMRDLFGCPVGLSDHTMGIGASVAATALGAVVIEKHFTLRRSDGGVDAAFSLEPEELTSLVVETERAWQALGSIHYGHTEAEVHARTRRRSLYVVADLKAGDVLTKDNIRAIRPGLGMQPQFLDIVLGMRVTQNVSTGTPLSWDHLKQKSPEKP